MAPSLGGRYRYSEHFDNISIRKLNYFVISVFCFQATDILGALVILWETSTGRGLNAHIHHAGGR